MLKNTLIKILRNSQSLFWKKRYFAKDYVSTHYFSCKVNKISSNFHIKVITFFRNTYVIYVCIERNILLTKFSTQWFFFIEHWYWIPLTCKSFSN